MLTGYYYYYLIFVLNSFFHFVSFLGFCVFRYSLGVTQEEMKQELHEYLPSLEHWAKEYLISPTPKAISLKMYVQLNLRSCIQHKY